MKKYKITPIILIVVSLILAIVSYIVLPQSVIIQFSVGSTGNKTVPKLVSLLIPFALGAGGAISVLLEKENTKGKGLLVSLTGILLFIIMICVNSL